MKRKLTVEDEMLTEGVVNITSSETDGHRAITESSLPWPCYRRHDHDASILFVGPRATGTSSLAVIAGSILGWKIVDCDREFERLTGSTKQQYRRRYGAERYRQRKLDVVQEVLEANPTRGVFACGTITSWEKNSFFSTYAQKHPIVYVIRERKLMQSYLGVVDDDGWKTAVEHMHFFFRQRSNYEFFNLNEAEEPQWQTTLTKFAEARSQTPSQVPQVLRKTRAHVSILLRQIFGSSFQTERYAGIERFPEPEPELREGSHVLCVDLDDIKSNSEFLTTLDSGHDAVQLNINGSTCHWHSILATDTLAWAIAALRRQLDIPIVVNIETFADGGDSLTASFPKVYELLLHLILRLAPDYLTVDLCSEDQVISKIVQTKGLTRVIGYFHIDRAFDSLQDSEEMLRQYRRAHNFGCDLVRFTGRSGSIEDNTFCQQVSSSISKLGLTTPAMVFNFGSLGRLSQVLNRVMTPVIANVEWPLSRQNSAVKLGLTSAQELRKIRHMLVPVKKTKFYVFGAEVRQSLSPAMHNAGFTSCGLPFAYEARESPDVTSIQEVSSQPSFGGASISLPFKSQVLELTARQSPAVRLIGAANTILPVPSHSRSLDDGQDELNNIDSPTQLVAENTDWMGIYVCVANHCTPANHITKETSALVLGAGGIARAAIYALLKLGVGHILILNRTHENAIKLKEHFEHVCDGSHHSDDTLSLGSHKISNPTFHVLKSYEERWPEEVHLPSVIVCAIPARDTEDIPEYPPELQPDWFNNSTGGLIADLTWKPRATGLGKQLKERKPRGWVCIDPIEILYEQGCAQFELFTKCRAPRKAMLDAFLSQYAVTYGFNGV